MSQIVKNKPENHYGFFTDHKIIRMQPHEKMIVVPIWVYDIMDTNLKDLLNSNDPVARDIGKIIVQDKYNYNIDKLSYGK